MDAVTLALIKSMAGNGGGSSLPPVTSSDNGKVLAVENGAWAKGTNNRPTMMGRYADNVQIIPVTTLDGVTFTTTITPQDIDNGYDITFQGDTRHCPGYNESAYTLLYINDGMETLFVNFVDESSDGTSFSSRIIEAEYGTAFVVSLYTERYDLPYYVQLTKWQREPSKFIVTLTPTAADFSGTMDKTVAEINAAYEAGMEIWFSMDDGNGLTYNVPCDEVIKYTSETYPSFDAKVLVTSLDAIVYVSTGTTNAGTETTYGTSIYALTPAS